MLPGLFSIYVITAVSIVIVVVLFLRRELLYRSLLLRSLIWCLRLLLWLLLRDYLIYAGSLVRIRCGSWLQLIILSTILGATYHHSPNPLAPSRWLSSICKHRGGPILVVQNPLLLRRCHISSVFIQGRLIKCPIGREQEAAFIEGLAYLVAVAHEKHSGIDGIL